MPLQISKRIICVVSCLLVFKLSANEKPPQGGRIIAKNEATLTLDIAGTIKTIHHEIGDIVKQGDKLITLDCDLLKAKYKAARSLAGVSKQKEKLIRDEHELGVTSLSELKIAAASSVAANDEARSTKAYLDKCTLSAPIAGTIVDIQKSKGEYISPGDPVIIITDNSEIMIEFLASQIHWQKYQPGVPITAHVTGNQSIEIKAEVVAKSARVDPDSLQFKVIAKITNNPDAVAGMQIKIVD